MLRFSLLIALALAPAAGAQVAHPILSLRAGDTVRVWTTSPAEQVGVVTSARADTLGVRRLDGRALAFPVAALSHVDVQRGSRRSPIVIVGGILAGGAIGAVLGAWGGAALECADGCEGEYGGLGGFLVGGTIGTVAGAITGGVLGGRYRSRRWEKVYP